jgi:hypothetical protein
MLFPFISFANISLYSLHNFFEHSIFPLVVGRKESVAELKMMVTTIHKEMRMMQAQLNSYKNAASVVHSLRAEMQSMDVLLKRQVRSHQPVSKCILQTSTADLQDCKII